MSQTTQSQQWLGIGLAIIGASGFACSVVLARMSYDHGTNAMTIMSVRFALLAVLMWLWSSWRGETKLIRPKLVVGCLAISVTYFVGIGAYLSSVAYLPVSLAVLIFYTFPILTALISAAVDRRWPRALELAALAAAFFGLLVALDVDMTGQQSLDLHPLGLLLAICASIGVATNMVSSGAIMKRLDTSVFSLYLAIGACVISTVVAVSGEGYHLPYGETGWWAFSLMLLSFCAAFVATYSGVRLIGPVRISTVMNLEPIATILIAVALLGETLGNSQLLGGAVVITAVVLAQWPRRRVTTASPASSETR